MKTRSLTRTGCTPARVVILSGVALLCLTLSGCGINITPQATDSSSDEPTDPAAGGTPMASTDSGHGASPAMPTDSGHGASPAMPTDSGHGASPAMPTGMSPGMPDMHGGDDGSALVMDTTAMAEEMHGADAGSTDAATLEPTAVPEAMHAADASIDPIAAGPNALDPAAMRADAGAGAGAADQGDSGDGRGSSRASRFEEGSAPHVVMLMVEAIDAGDMETAARYISDDADGLLGSVRDGSAGENQLLQLKSYFATMDPFSSRPRGRSVTLVFNGALDKVLSFDVVREGRGFVVDAMTIRDAQTRGR